MRDAGIVFGRRAEADIKNFVIVVRRNVKKFRARLDVFKLVSLGVQLADFGNIFQAKAVQNFADF